MSDHETSPELEQRSEDGSAHGEENGSGAHRRVRSPSASPPPARKKTTKRTRREPSAESPARERERSKTPPRKHRRRTTRSRSRSLTPPVRNYRRSRSPPPRRGRSPPPYRGGGRFSGGGDRYGYGGGGYGGRGDGGYGGSAHYQGGRFEEKKYNDGRENPEPNRCLGIFGMSLHTSERDLKRIFGVYGDIETVQIVYDRFSGRSRGFGFVYFERKEDAIKAKDRLLDQEIDGARVRIDFSVTKGAGPKGDSYNGGDGGRDRSVERYGSRNRRSPSY